MKILYVSLADWYWIKQRPQSIAEQIAKDDTVDYFCVRPWRKSTKSVSHKNNQQMDQIKIQVSKNLTVYRSHVLPKNSNKVIKTINDKLILKNQIKKMLIANEYDAIILTHPDQMNYFESFPSDCKLIYDCMDNYLELIDKSDILQTEKKLLEISDLQIFSSETLMNTVVKRYKVSLNAKVINNAVDVELFSNFEKSNKNLGKVIGYVGTISSWFDFDTINFIASKLTDYTIIIVGPIDDELSKKFTVSNIEVLGPKPFYKMPEYIDQFDIAVMPFKINDLIRSVNPVKIYEYLSMGKDIIATDYPETQKFDDLISVYNTKEDFLKQIHDFNDHPTTRKKRNIRIKFAINNNWDNRGEEYLSAIHSIL